MSGFQSVALVALLLVCSSLPLLVSGHFEPNPLSKIQLHNIQRRLNGGAVRIEAEALYGLGETVNVSFSGMSTTGGDQDWVGVWSPPPVDGNYSAVSPSKYKMVRPDSSGSGIVPLWLLNMRAAVVVAYFSGGLDAPVLLAESEAVSFANTALPMHIHLALTDDPTQMRIDWTSEQSSGLWLRWGEQPNNLTFAVPHVSTSTYTADDMCGPPATTVGFRSPGFLHSALLEGLRPNTHYFYRLGGATHVSVSRVLDFYSAPAPDAQDVQFVIFGDLGQVETDGSNEASEMDGSILTTRALSRDIEEGRLQLAASAAVFHIGDISYARGYVTIWEQFFSQLAAFSPHLPWMTVDGNHERDWPGSGSVWTGTDSGGECGVALAQRFHMPSPTGLAPTSQTWWSLDFGPVHFTVISTELDFNETSAQYAWISRDLQAVDRSKTPFLLLAGHRPMYIDSTNDDPFGGDLPVGRQLMAALEPLMQKYQVDAAFWGHHHSLQRTCPAHNWTCVSETEGTIHIVTGGAGAGFSDNVQSPMPNWIRFLNYSTHGYVVAHVKQRQTLTLQFIDAGRRVVMDSVTIKSKHQPQPLRQ